MKKLFLFKAILLLAVFGSYGQFSESFQNPFPHSCDHYSIEKAPETAAYSYVAAGTFFHGTHTSMHIFTTDDFGQLLWENHVEIPGTSCRALDVAVGKNSEVAITGFVETVSGTELYAALYEQTSGVLIYDYQYANANSASGSNIIYSIVNDHYIIGGFETSGADGNGLLIALDGGFNQLWARTYDSQCDGFNMSVINDIVEVNTEYFITGNLSNASDPAVTGTSQVLAAIVRSSDGTILDNESFRATSEELQEAMGVSAHFNPDDQELVLLYNVSRHSPTIDENRPYVAKFRVTGVNLLFDVGYRIGPFFPAPPNPPTTGIPFTDKPNFTGLKILRHDHVGTYIIFGMLDDYGASDKRVLSVYQEFDFDGNLTSTAKYWTRSDIPSALGFPTQGGFYSLFDGNALKTNVYTPESTCLNIDLNNFVSILPTEDGGFSFDIISSSLNTLAANSICIPDFEVELYGQEIDSPICLSVFDATGTNSQPAYPPVLIESIQMEECEIINSPAMGNSEIDAVAANKLTLLANPAHDVLTFSVSETGTYNAVIMNMEGRVLIQSTIANTASQNQLNIANLASGLYVLTVTNENGQILKEQFVKE